MKLEDLLAKLAVQAMVEKGLEPEFSAAELQQLALIKAPANSSSSQDLCSLLWCSIDNYDSRDLDQLTYAEKQGDKIVLWIAIADVDALVKKDTPLDQHAHANTTSVYTPARIFPMLPEKLSTDLTSLNEKQRRASIVVKIDLDLLGNLTNPSIFEALVCNYAKLSYEEIGPWLAGTQPLPNKVAQVPGMEKALRIQHEAAQLLKKKRHAEGALTLQSPEAEVKIDPLSRGESETIHIELPAHNYAHQLIEEFMIAANRTMAEQFKKAQLISLRRVVKTPKYWGRIVDTAKALGGQLPEKPDAKALENFLSERQKKDPERFPDLSLTIIKLLGRGEYMVVDEPGGEHGHFALALSEYTHSSAPNRRFPDLIAQRQCKALLRGEKAPYSVEELHKLAEHCTQQEDAAMKVERRLNKSAAAAVLAPHIGDIFQGIITGAGETGTWVRLFQPAVEGKVVQGFENLQIGDKVSVQLLAADIAKGFIDFCLVLNTGSNSFAKPSPINA
jgi:exoribonuclease-2